LFHLIFIDLQNVGVISAAPCIIIHLKAKLPRPVLPLPSPGTHNRLYLSVVLTLQHTIQNKKTNLSTT